MTDDTFIPETPVEKEWQECMNVLYVNLQKFDAPHVYNSGDNAIIWKHSGIEWEIASLMVNNKYIEVRLSKDYKERASFVHDNNIEHISMSIIILVAGKQ